MYVNKIYATIIIIIEDCIDASIQGFKKDIKKSKERQITAAANNNGNIRTKRKTTKRQKQKWEEKQLYRYFKQKPGEIAHGKMDTVKKGKSQDRN